MSDLDASVIKPGAVTPDILPSGPIRRSSSRSCGASVVLIFYRPTGVRCAAIRSRSTTSCCRVLTLRGQLSHLGRWAWCHAAFAADHKLRFPLLADFEPKGASPASTVPSRFGRLLQASAHRD